MERKHTNISNIMKQKLTKINNIMKQKLKIAFDVIVIICIFWIRSFLCNKIGVDDWKSDPALLPV